VASSSTTIGGAEQQPGDGSRCRSPPDSR
jgi:hypothetical protein